MLEKQKKFTFIHSCASLHWLSFSSASLIGCHNFQYFGQYIEIGLKINNLALHLVEIYTDPALDPKWWAMDANSDPDPPK